MQPLSVFSSAFALRAAQTAWLIGAGGSAEAGVPTASQIVDLLLIELYCRDHRVKKDDLRADDRWRDLIYSVYSGQGGLPPVEDIGFYSAIFERVYPDADARARFVMDVLGGKKPHYGQHQLAALAAARRAELVVTTNFDTLIEDAIRDMLSADTGGQQRLTVLEPQNSGRADFAHASDQHPLLVKIHGDYGSVTLSNTDAELATHDPKLRDLVTAQLGRYGLIVAGYSGRDPAVMAMLTNVMNHPRPFPAGLTWIRRPEDHLSQSARDLLQAAVDAGVSPVTEVLAGGFTELMTALTRPINFSQAIEQRLGTLTPPAVRLPASRPIGSTQAYPQVRFGAVELTALPSHARVLANPGSADLAEIRRLLRADRVAATVGLVDGKLLAFGPDAAMRSALEPLDISNTTADASLGLLQHGGPRSAAVGMLVEALAQGLGRAPGLATVLRARHRPMVRVQAPPAGAGGKTSSPTVKGLQEAVQGPVAGVLKGVDGAMLPWAEAATITIEHIDGRWFFLFAPDIWVRPTFIDSSGRSVGTKADADRTAADFIGARLAGRYNRQAGAILGAWLKLFSGGGDRTLAAHGVAPGAGIDAVFTFTGRPLISRQLAGGTIAINGVSGG